MNRRAIVSLLLLLSSIIMPVSAVIAHATGWSLVSHTWLHLHVISGFVFCIAGVTHIVYNWRSLKKSFMDKEKKGLKFVERDVPLSF